MKNFFYHRSAQSARFLAKILTIMELLMLDKYKRFIEEAIAYKAVLPSQTWLMHTLDSFAATFYDKPQKDDLAYFKKWEREKIISLGLASAPHPLRRSPAKDIRFHSWNQEKALSFGLTKSAPVKKTEPEQFSWLKQIILPVIHKLNLQLRAFLEKQNAQNQQLEKPDSEKGNEDFFKTLGYE